MHKYNVVCEYEIIADVRRSPTALLFNVYKEEYKTFADAIARAVRNNLHFVFRDLIIKNSTHFLDNDGDQIIMCYEATIEAPDDVTEEGLEGALTGFARAHWFDATAEELGVNRSDFVDGAVVLSSKPLDVSIRKAAES